MSNITGNSNLYAYNSYNYGLSYNYASAFKTTSASKASYTSQTSQTSEETKSFVAMVKKYSADLKTSVDSMFNQFPPVFKKVIAESSNTEAVDVKTNDVKAFTSGLKSGDKTEISVQQVAQGQENKGTSVAAAAISSATKGTNYFSIDVGGKSVDLDVNVLSSDSNKAVQQKVADAINKKGIGVTATVNYDDKTKQSSLVIKSNSTGEKNGFTVKDTKGGNVISTLGVASATTTAKDAKYKVDGKELTSASNEVNVGHGVTATLKKVTDKDVTIGSKKDVNSAVNAVYALTNNFNGLLEQAKGSDSRGAQSAVTQLTGTMKSYASTLSRVGITSNSKGYIELDTEKLKKAAEDGSLEKALGADVKSGSYGFASRIQRIARNTTSDPGSFVEQKKPTSHSNVSTSYNYNFSAIKNTQTTSLLNLLY